ncbi:hypothetical protein AB6A40_008812, partial [Gnathostoma spinigerum]
RIMSRAEEHEWRTDPMNRFNACLVARALLKRFKESYAMAVGKITTVPNLVCVAVCILSLNAEVILHSESMANRMEPLCSIYYKAHLNFEELQKTQADGVLCNNLRVIPQMARLHLIFVFICAFLQQVSIFLLSKACYLFLCNSFQNS